MTIDLQAEVKRLQEQIETMATLAGEPDAPVITGSASDAADPRIVWYKPTDRLGYLCELAKVVREIAEFEHWHLFPPHESCATDKYCRCVEKKRVAELLKKLDR